VKTGDSPAVIGTASGPKKQVTAFILERSQPLSRTVEQLAIRIHQRQVHVDKDVGVFHCRCFEETRAPSATQNQL
jgi:hypothetical protein